MEIEDTYIVPLKDLEIGDHEFHYALDDKFFEMVDGPEVNSGKVKLSFSKVKAQKKEKEFGTSIYLVTDEPLSVSLATSSVVSESRSLS